MRNAVKRLHEWSVGERRTRPRFAEEPLRGEVFNIVQLQQHARALAAEHTLVTRKGANRLLSRLDKNEAVLRAFQRSSAAMHQKRRLVPATEWFLDNFYLIEEQIHIARRHLPREYSRELPALAAGSSAGLPRVYDIVLNLVSHLDAQIDLDSVRAYFSAYGEVTPLKLGELWAVPIMLRLALIENLHRIASILFKSRRDRQAAEQWVDKLQKVAETEPSRLVTVVAEMARADPNLSSAFVAEFSERLPRQNPQLAMARTWIDNRLSEQGLSPERLIHLESQSQAANQISVSHSINSLRLLSATDWKDFVEEQSIVDRTLRTDPAQVYPLMDFATRDRYRHVVEDVARLSDLSESDAANLAIGLAEKSAAEKGAADRSAHVGYFLIDDGLRAFEAGAKVRRPWRSLVERGIRSRPVSFYVAGILIIAGLTAVAFAVNAQQLGIHGRWLLLLTLLFLFPASQLGVSLLNWFSTMLVKPRLLPRMDFTDGITPEARTMVAIPTLITSAAGVDHLLESVELHYLANRDANLHFALLTDFRDADQERLPGDDALLEKVEAGIDALNQKYPARGRTLFFLFHRPRKWNASEGVWMAYERKRGKLMQFNALLRGSASEAFSVIIGNTSILPTVKYVIALDTDTQLPPDSARQLAGAMAHPLNRPSFDANRKVVTHGYSILQPRVGVSLPTSRRSWFVRLVAGDAGVDPYTRAVSDVYQDLFGEGSFIGKGIYDVDAFQRSMEGRFPENMILSHDLLESVHGRSALVSDVQLYEDFPSRYNVDVARRHRWIRGDWQIARWLLPMTPGPGEREEENPLSEISRWKILDNLRRSLVPVASTALLVGNWLLYPQLGAFGPALILAILALPVALSEVMALLRKAKELPWSIHVRTVFSSSARNAAQILLTLAFLPYDAFVSADAIARTLVRLLITRKRLLEWKTSSDSEMTARTDVLSFYSAMWFAPVMTAFFVAYLWRVNPSDVSHALPILALWIAAPWIAWRISKPIPSPPAGLSSEQLAFLRRTARKTWQFFESYVTADNQWLPPDNYQEEAAKGVAPRTSPTNMGLALLANLAAWDFGYLSTGAVIERTQNAFGTMQKMQRYRGHFYNWYDTQTLQPLLPLYVSTVDSGNLSGHLLTLAAGLRELAGAAVLNQNAIPGIKDTIGVMKAEGSKSAILTQIDSELAAPRRSLSEHSAMFMRVASLAQQLAADERESGPWARSLQRCCEAHASDIAELSQPALSAGDASTSLVLEGIPTLREIAIGAAGAVASERAQSRIRLLEELAASAEGLALVDYSFLFNGPRDIFSIGYNVTEKKVDASYYDLLASEARLGSYVAIAEGQIHQAHWFSLGRLLVSVGGEQILVSWSGSMFEYLMPLLVMPNYEGAILDQTCKEAVKQQIEYGKARGIPWGISESGYNRTDANLNYQYRAFGVPGIGLKRGLAEDLVIAPYASIMALMVAPKAACENLQRLAADGRDGAFGFYEAVDYTPSRLPPNQASITIKSYMAHHQGMALLALDYLLQDMPMQRRFMSSPELKAVDLLLQERIPKAATTVLSTEFDLEESRAYPLVDEVAMRVVNDPAPPTPQIHLLSNGTYHLMITSSGGGYSRWRNLALTRWREDSTRDSWGLFIYLRDLGNGDFWSVGSQPTLRVTKQYEAVFTPGRAEFRQRHSGLKVHAEISVSPEDDVELRRVTITNLSRSMRTIELTSYGEVVLAPAAADDAHPAFSNLFVQTEFDAKTSAILCTRRPRSQEENPPWLLHLMTAQGGSQGVLSCETDRARFIGRGGSLARPAAMQSQGGLSNTVGSVLDPIISLRRTVRLAPNESAVFVMVVGATGTREAASALVEKYTGPRMADRAFDLAWTHNQVILRHIDASDVEAQNYAIMAAALLYADPARRATPAILMHNRRQQNGLWGYGISGDLPIVLLTLTDSNRIAIARDLVKAHSYWRMKGLAVDLVILNDDASSYRAALNDALISMIVSGQGAQFLDKPGGIFIRRLDQVSPDDRILLQSVARIVLTGDQGSLSDQLDSRNVVEPLVPLLEPRRAIVPNLPRPAPARELLFENGFGGFTLDGREYVITLQPGQYTPAPWVNVIANPNFGTVVSESGGAYTWLENAHEFRLTPWNNDAVKDPSGEALYIRDEQTGLYWSPTPLPARGATPYVIRHGFGYTVFEHEENGIISELCVYVAHDAPVKFLSLKLRNVSGRPRRISVTGYWEWVLGDLRQKSLLHVQTEVDLKSGALLARNRYNSEFFERIAYVDVNVAERTVTGDRKEFIGRNSSLSQPAAMKRERLSNRTGAGLDPCGAVQVAIDLPDQDERTVCFRVGVGRSLADTQELIARYRLAGADQAALEAVWEYWNRTLGAVNVTTPDPAVNVMANGWLLYQTLSCRMWGRTGFYQSGGAYGFRDQLQDSMALVYAEPALTREHLLRAAAHQFREGDVQHWWHPPAGRGVRTHFSDDYLWLPFVTAHYVSRVGDTGVLDEKINFLEGRPVKPEEEAYYDLPVRSEETATLYDHCVRAIENGLRFGAHGLPLMGCGDWNDGMNMVGKEGRGESVWLAFFLYDVLEQFAEIARNRGELAFTERCLSQAERLRKNIEENAWDGEWYRRAYFDNGDPLGSRSKAECQIDSLPQSWSVISGAGDPARSRQAMNAVDERLVRRKEKLIQLFDPPFDHGAQNPGYIKGYIPGVRENGGQYTHGAIWAVMAFAELGDSDRAWELFNLLNPPHHGGTPEQIAVYKVEPYVVAADIYAVPPHTSRGGWTWYTGSAGWMYRLLVETLLGFKIEGDQLRVTPHLPAGWSGFTIHYRFRDTPYHITVERAAGGPGATLDNSNIPGGRIPLVDDRQEHVIRIVVRS
ncbi:glucoamylase family protein [soil metagenome]